MSTRTEKLLSFLSTQPPSERSSVLHALYQLNPNLADLLQQLIPFPFKSVLDPTTGKQFILSDFNREQGLIYRSPWTSANVDVEANVAIGSFGNSPLPIRRLEVAFNELYSSYCAVYFGAASDSVSSVYVWETKDGFEGAFLCRRSLGRSDEDETEGLWESAHVMRCVIDDDCADISVYSSVNAFIEFSVPCADEARARFEFNKDKSVEGKKVDIQKSSMKLTEEVLIRVIGEAVEDNENWIRRQVEQFHFEKCIDNLRERRKGVADKIFSTLNNKYDN